MCSDRPVNPKKVLNRIMTEDSTDLFLVVNEHEFGEHSLNEIEPTTANTVTLLPQRTYLFLPIFKQIGGGNICFVGFVIKAGLQIGARF